MYKDKQIEARDVKRLLLKVYKRYQAGSITDVQANKETYILNSILKAVEVTDLEDKLKGVEEILKRGV
jgi:hypothetical protein